MIVCSRSLIFIIETVRNLRHSLNRNLPYSSFENSKYIRSFESKIYSYYTENMTYSKFHKYHPQSSDARISYDSEIENLHRYELLIDENIIESNKQIKSYDFIEI